jgi:hypothetical protein
MMNPDCSQRLSCIWSGESRGAVLAQKLRQGKTDIVIVVDDDNDNIIERDERMHNVGANLTSTVVRAAEMHRS